MSTADLDTTELPKFDAVKARVADPGVLKWLGKLEAWCAHAIAEQARLNKSIEDRNGTIEDFERAAAEQGKLEDFIERIGQRIADTERGIYTLDETADWLRRENR